MITIFFVLMVLMFCIQVIPFVWILFEKVFKDD